MIILTIVSAPSYRLVLINTLKVQKHSHTYFLKSHGKQLNVLKQHAKEIT